MRRARTKNSDPNNDCIKRNKFKYHSDMEELGYDPDTFVENEEDTAAKSDSGDTEPDIDTVNTDMAETMRIPKIDPDEISETSEEINDFEKSAPNEETADIKKKKKMSRGKKRLLIFSVSLLTIVVGFFVVLGIGGFFSNTEEEINEDFVVPVDKATGRINVLVLGVDKDGLRTDTIIVASYDLDNNKVSMLSIPRDTRMYVGNRYQKINAAHAISQSGKIKGPQGSIEAVTRLTGIPINYYVEFSFDAFKNTIDALGGVDFDVPRDMDYEDPVQDLYIHLKQGYQHLDGDKAEQLVRFRRYPEGDIARVRMQQDFVKAVAEQKLNVGILTKLPDIYNVLKDDVSTNFTIMDITKYVNNLKELSSDNIQMFQLPGQFGGAEYTTSYWIPNMDEIKTLVQTEFEYDAENATIHSEDNSSVSKENADRKATKAPATEKPSQTAKSSSKSSPKATSKATEKAKTHSPKPSKSAESTHNTTTHTAKPSAAATKTPEQTHTSKPVQSHETVPTAKPTQKPTEKPAEQPTPKPTQRPARPTPNVAAEGEE